VVEATAAVALCLLAAQTLACSRDARSPAGSAPMPHQVGPASPQEGESDGSAVPPVVVGLLGAPDVPHPAAEPVEPVFAVRAEEGAVRIRAPSGDEAELRFEAQATAADGAWTAALRDWQRGGDELRSAAELGSARWSVALEADPTRPVLVLRVQVDYGNAVEVVREDLVVTVPGAVDARTLGRDLAPRDIDPDAEYLTDPWTPLEVAAGTPAGRVTVLRRSGFPSAVASRDDGGLRLRLQLDDAGNHPYQPYAECFETYARDNPRNDLSTTPRAAG
jgi:hypothetical protein